MKWHVSTVVLRAAFTTFALSVGFELLGATVTVRTKEEFHDAVVVASDGGGSLSRDLDIVFAHGCEKVTVVAMIACAAVVETRGRNG